VSRPLGLQALVWDVDGTLAETERDGHRVAFNMAFEDCGLPWRWDEARYGRLLRITGGRERLMHDMQDRADAPRVPSERDALARDVHRRKNRHYEELVQGGRIALRPGVIELVDECRSAGVRLAIATTTSRSNVAALLGVHLGPDWSATFEVVVCGEDVRHKKPDPEAFVLAMSRLGVGAVGAVAVEDSPGGVAAARGAGCPVVVTRSSYFMDDPIEGAIAIGPGLHSRAGWHPALPGTGVGRVTLADIAHWHALQDTVSSYP
jgi:HAD superfamily hydrolase (TIGR01509 family)